MDVIPPRAVSPSATPPILPRVATPKPPTSVPVSAALPAQQPAAAAAPSLDPEANPEAVLATPALPAARVSGSMGAMPPACPYPSRDSLALAAKIYDEEVISAGLQALDPKAYAGALYTDRYGAAVSQMARLLGPDLLAKMAALRDTPAGETIFKRIPECAFAALRQAASNVAPATRAPSPQEDDRDLAALLLWVPALAGAAITISSQNVLAALPAEAQQIARDVATSPLWRAFAARMAAMAIWDNAIRDSRGDDLDTDQGPNVDAALADLMQAWQAYRVAVPGDSMLAPYDPILADHVDALMVWLAQQWAQNPTALLEQRQPLRRIIPILQSLVPESSPRGVVLPPGITVFADDLFDSIPPLQSRIHLHRWHGVLQVEGANLLAGLGLPQTTLPWTRCSPPTCTG